jgi:hypothetical protein
VAERSELRSVAAAEGGSPQIIIYQVKYLKAFRSNVFGLGEGGDFHHKC